MRLRLVLHATSAILILSIATADELKKVHLDLQSGSLSPGLPLGEVEGGVHRVRLVAQLDEEGEGEGTLTLDPNAPEYEEFGMETTAGSLPSAMLRCRLKFVKRGGPCRLYEIRGPKITSRLSLVTERTPASSGRLLVLGKEGKVKYVVPLLEIPTVPCHPGCFPAGTLVRVPGGTRPVEGLHEGDLVSTLGEDGEVLRARVAGVFATRNRLVEVRTEGGRLVTTGTQPLCLAGGGFRQAADLKAGDRICRWGGEGRRPVAVLEVRPTGREGRVFNLVLGEPTTFIAGDFLVRSKPPAPVPVPAP